MSLHEDIKAACAEAAPAIARAATGAEASIYNLPHYVADLVVVLLRYDALADALKTRGVEVSQRQPVPNKSA